MKLYNAIGICGAHRVGKTTLARHIAEDKGINLVLTNVGDIFIKETKYLPSDHIPFLERLDIQWRILQKCSLLWDTQNGPFVTDRTPIDFIGYILLNVTNTTMDHSKEVNEYTNECLSVLNSTFTYLIHLQPFIEIISDLVKANTNPLYIEHLNAIIAGLLHSDHNLVKSITVPKVHTYQARKYI